MVQRLWGGGGRYVQGGLLAKLAAPCHDAPCAWHISSAMLKRLASAATVMGQSSREAGQNMRYAKRARKKTSTGLDAAGN